MDAGDSILIVEDLSEDVMLLRLAIKRAGVSNRIEVVPDGLEAMYYLKGTGKYSDRIRYPFPRMIFTDLKMLAMDGWEFLAWLRAHPKCAIIPVIVLSASSLDEDVRKAYQLGANAYLAKPSGLDDLAEMLKAAFTFWGWCKKPDLPGKC